MDGDQLSDWAETMTTRLMNMMSALRVSEAKKNAMAFEVVLELWLRPAHAYTTSSSWRPATGGNQRPATRGNQRPASHHRC